MIIRGLIYTVTDVSFVVMYHTKHIRLLCKHKHKILHYQVRHLSDHTVKQERFHITLLYSSSVINLQPSQCLSPCYFKTQKKLLLEVHLPETGVPVWGSTLWAVSRPLGFLTMYAGCLATSHGQRILPQLKNWLLYGSTREQALCGGVGCSTRSKNGLHFTWKLLKWAQWWLASLSSEASAQTVHIMFRGMVPTLRTSSRKISARHKTFLPMHSKLRVKHDSPALSSPLVWDTLYLVHSF